MKPHPMKPNQATMTNAINPARKNITAFRPLCTEGAREIFVASSMLFRRCKSFICYHRHLALISKCNGCARQSEPRINVKKQDYYHKAQGLYLASCPCLDEKRKIRSGSPTFPVSLERRLCSLLTACETGSAPFLSKDNRLLRRNWARWFASSPIAAQTLPAEFSKSCVGRVSATIHNDLRQRCAVWRCSKNKTV
jgi:hypothetical protein